MRYVFLIALALPITAHGQSSITATGPLASPIATLPRTPMTADDIIKAAKDNRVVVVQDGKKLWPVVKDDQNGMTVGTVAPIVMGDKAGEPIGGTHQVTGGGAKIALSPDLTKLQPGDVWRDSKGNEWSVGMDGKTVCSFHDWPGNSQTQCGGLTDDWPPRPLGKPGTENAECKPPDVIREVYREGWKKTSHKDISCDKVSPGQTVIMPCNWVDVPDKRPTDQICVSPDRLKEAEHRYLDQFKPPPIMPLNQYYAPDEPSDCFNGEHNGPSGQCEK